MRGFKKFIVVVGLAITVTGCLQTATTIMGRPELANVLKGEYGQVVDQLEPILDKGGHLPSVRLHLLCTAYGKVKRYDRLFPCLDRFRRQIESGDNVPLAPVSGFRLENQRLDSNEPIIRAEAELELGRYEDAIRSAERALAMNAEVTAQILARTPDALNILGLKTGAKNARNYDNIRAWATKGLALALTGQEAAALDTIRQMQSYEIYIADPYSPEARDTGSARIYMALGRYTDALEIVQRSREGAFTKLFASAVLMDSDVSLFSEMPLLFMQAKATMENGDHQRAKIAYDKLAQLPQLRQSGGLHWQLLFDRGRIALIEGDPEGAIVYFKEAVEVIEAQRSTIGSEASKIGFVGDKQAVYEALIKTLVEARRFDAAFDYVERAKARALVDLLAEKKTFRADPAQAGAVSALLASLQRAEREASVLDERATVADIKRTRGLPVQVKQQIAQAAPELASLVSVSTPGLQEITRLLPQGETLVEYYGSGRVLYAFVVSKAGITAVTLDAEDLREQVAVFRRALADPRSTRHRSIGAGLYDRLVAPVAPLIKGDSITIVPHGPLHYLPFAAMPAGDGHLIDTYSIRILPSASVMRFLKRRHGQQNALLAIGNPQLNDPRLDLPGAEREARELGKGRPGAVVLIRGRATETVVKRTGGAFRRLHFASHGTFEPDAPLQSALLLAKDGANDGRLTVGELYDLRLNADLVTLSACETGLGHVASGDDVVGFARGFLYAGASSIVASLWKVDDEATSRLMQSFYKRLGAGADKRSALRSAQRELRESYNDHPFFWAAFQLTGAIQ